MIGAFIDHRLSEDVAYGFTGGPQWNTEDVPLRSGHVDSIQRWVYPLCRYQCNYALLHPVLQDEILNALWVARGKARRFRFLDHNDYQAVDQPLAEPATTSTPIQLTRTYTWGGEIFVRPIDLPRDVALKVDGSPYTDFTVDPLTGLATPTTTWPAGAKTWSGEFDVRVRFAADYHGLTRARPKVSTAMIELEEMRRR